MSRHPGAQNQFRGDVIVVVIVVVVVVVVVEKGNSIVVEIEYEKVL